MACLPCTRPYYAGEFALKPKISSLLLRILFQFLALFQFKHSLLFCLFSLAAFLFAFLLLCFPLHPFWISFDILYNSFNNRTEFQTEVPLLNIFLYFTIFWLCTKCSRWYSLKSVFTKAIIVGLRLLCPCRSVLLVEIMVDKRRVIIVYRQGGIIQSGQQVRSDITDI